MRGRLLYVSLDIVTGPIWSDYGFVFFKVLRESLGTLL